MAGSLLMLVLSHTGRGNLAARTAADSSPAASMKPLLFMEERDLIDTFGKLKLVANEVPRTICSLSLVSRASH
jgi:hypothetical protein